MNEKTEPTTVEGVMAEFEVLWNEHDGTHFYKDEWRDWLHSRLTALLNEIAEEVEAGSISEAMTLEKDKKYSSEQMHDILDGLIEAHGYNTALKDVTALIRKRINNNE